VLRKCDCPEPITVIPLVSTTKSQFRDITRKQYENSRVPLNLNNIEKTIEDTESKLQTIMERWL